MADGADARLGGLQRRAGGGRVGLVVQQAGVQQVQLRLAAAVAVRADQAGGLGVLGGGLDQGRGGVCRVRR